MNLVNIINNKIFFFFYDLINKNIFVDNLIFFFAEYLPYLVVVILFFYILLHKETYENTKTIFNNNKKVKEFFVVFLSMIFSWAFSVWVKNIISSPRPYLFFENIKPLFLHDTFAFPSGHTLFFATLGFVFFKYHKTIGFFLIITTFVVGLARISAGVHFPIDILGGFIFGYLIAYFIKRI
jgi:undecaprenyl-diphosphatase